MTIDIDLWNEARALGLEAAQTGHVVLVIVTLLKAASETDAYESVPPESIDEAAQLLYEAGW